MIPGLDAGSDLAFGALHELFFKRTKCSELCLREGERDRTRPVAVKSDQVTAAHPGVFTRAGKLRRRRPQLPGQCCLERWATKFRPGPRRELLVYCKNDHVMWIRDNEDLQLIFIFMLIFIFADPDEDLQPFLCLIWIWDNEDLQPSSLWTRGNGDL